jgi:hypothetical protein
LPDCEKDLLSEDLKLLPLQLIQVMALHGASTTYLGLTSAIEAGIAMGEDRNTLDQWMARADELKDAIVSSYNSSESRFLQYTGGSDNQCWTCGGRGPYWIIWPARVLPELKGTLRDEQLVVSIIAGGRLATLSEGLAHNATVRAMPNTPVMMELDIGQGRYAMT